MRIKSIIVILLFTLAIPVYSSDTRDHMIKNPQSWIEIPEWNVYSSWGGVGILHNLKIVNKSDLEYKNIKVRILHSGTSTGSSGIIISQQTGVIPVTLPPHSSQIYLRSGIPFGSNSHSMKPERIQVLGADYNP